VPAALDLVDLLAFCAGSLLLIWLSRKPLRHPGSHGFYRFLAWECMLALIILNRRPWGEDPFSAHQMIAWVLLLASIFLVVAAVRSLRQAGKSAAHRSDDALYEFEKTTQLVSEGIFRHIRHPMYASLLALAWGAFFQAPSWAGGSLVAAASLFLLLTALSDEKECLAYFGEAYADYMQRTRRFIPGLF
jgi:protein-S-isoprenylcysteine O-methyltransferase Ste14